MDATEPDEDPNVTASCSLPTPRELRRRFPLSADAGRTVGAARRAIAAAIRGRDPRLVVVVGPCSLHDPDAALDYARRLREAIAAVGDRLLIVMRTYVEKPRTALGWKGLVNDPRLDGSCDVAAGLEIARRTLLAINALGVPCGGEVLSPSTPQYLGDLLAWAAIGARTSQSQTHREIASGLPMPVGFKNGIDGAIDGALNGIVAAGQPHSFVTIGLDGGVTISRTRGNADCHVILRGGGGRPNCSAAHVERAAALVRALGSARGVMIDCSHDNSGKDPARQAGVCRAALRSRRLGEAGLLGLSIESNLRAGRQSWQADRPLEYGVSITDACIGWDETAALLDEVATSENEKSRAPNGARLVSA